MNVLPKVDFRASANRFLGNKNFNNESLNKIFSDFSKIANNKISWFRDEFN